VNGIRPYSAISGALRLHAGDDALSRMPREAARVDAHRAFVICGRSVANKTSLVDRVRSLLGDRYAGSYTRLGKDAPVEDVEEAAVAARAEGADLLIAIGAGSVLKAARVIAIALAEDRPLVELATRYPDNGAPVSPRLLQPKPPIFNVLTAATSAQNRGGAALRRSDGGPRLEFFDPKTRPAAIFWDSDALLTAPPSLALSTGLGVFWRALMNRGAMQGANPLVQADRLHAYALARQALDRMRNPEDAAARLDMCAAALLQNRDEDDGGRPFDAHWIARVVYALGAALFNRVPALDQGRTHAVLTAPALRRFGDLCPEAVAQMGEALGLAGRQAADPDCVIQAVEQVFRSVAVPDKLAGVSEQDCEYAVEAALYNFNADSARELGSHRPRLGAVLRDATRPDGGANPNRKTK
jgi:alcohol dehydrogenase class IV